MMASEKTGEKRLILGCGYVGLAVAREWLAEGHEVWAVSRNRERLAEIEEKGYRPVVAEVDAADWHSAVPADIGVVLNCVSSAGGGLSGYEKSYVGGNRSLCAWAARSEPARILYTGSTAVYPFVDGREVFEEDAGGDLSDTGRLVWESERILRENSAISDRTVILRLAGIYGPARHHLLDALRRGQTVFPGPGENFLNLIYLKDIVSAIQACADHPAAAGQTFNLVDNCAPRKQELVQWLAAQLGLLVTPHFDPEAPMQGRMRINAQGRLPNRRIQNRKIRNALGWNPAFPSYREGYADIGV